ncbi:hypothetical protein ACXU4B_15500 [Dyella soli]
MLSTATALALLAVMGPGIALAADSGTGVVMPDGSYAKPLQAYRNSLLTRTAASGPGLLAPATTNDASTLTRDMAAAWAFPATGSNGAWSRNYGRWTFASVTTAYAWSPNVAGGQAGASPTNPLSGASGDAAVGLAQFVASYRITPTSRIAVSYGVTGATSNFQSARRNYSAYNFWTFTPKVAYIKALATADGDASTVLAVGMFSRKTTAVYQNSAVGRIETLVMRQTTGGWSYGGVAAAIEKYTIDPTEPTYGKTNTGNFDGVGIGVGPQVNWNTRWHGNNVEFRCRWIYEFNGPGGRPSQPMLLSATVHL